MADGLFDQLENKEFFKEFVKQAEKSVPRELLPFFNLTNKVSTEGVDLAFDKYQYELNRYAAYLHSKNPDHYKRSGALLQSLCTNCFISGVKCDYTAEEIDAGLTRYSYSDSQYIQWYLQFQEEYCNEFAAFDIAWRACSAYSTVVKVLSFDLIHSICHYLKNNKTLPSDAYFMLFRTLAA